ncbi:hypothetical protein LTS18_008013 [Coniosporium uncinatum]|uniref:Uncharacterized protein n=1 Tax=Coniosporium uncinatum TaxID=93489 RepID=A0ACC3DCG4_9PEZI|nr:hypothetical protein LTS18_008013 [Coniosporium uncinatum]
METLNHHNNITYTTPQKSHTSSNKEAQLLLTYSRSDRLTCTFSIAKKRQSNFSKSFRSHFLLSTKWQNLKKLSIVRATAATQKILIPGPFPQEESDPASAAPPLPRAVPSLFGHLDTRRAAARLGSQTRLPANPQIAANNAITFPYSRANSRPAELAERAGEVARTRRRDREDQRVWYQQPLPPPWAAQPQPFDEIADETMHDGNDASDLPEAITTDAPPLQERIGYRADFFNGDPSRRYGYQPAAPARPLHHYRRNAAVQINGVWAPPPQPPPYPGNYEA